VVEIPFCEDTVIDVNGRRPVNAGGTTVTCTDDVLVAVVTVIVGASGSVAVIIVAVPARLVPSRFVANPSIVYVALFNNPLNTVVVDNTLFLTLLSIDKLPGVTNALNDVIGKKGAVDVLNVSITVPEPILATVIAGTPGTGN
jgi:hypothetical protein